MVEINPETCEQIAETLRNQSVPVDREDTSLPGFSSEETGNFYLFLVAICHQTTPRIGLPLEGLVAGVHKRGWDYLSARLEEAFAGDPTLFTPLRWSEFNGAELAAFCGDPQFGERLTEPEERAALIRDLGEVMLAHDWKWAQQLYEVCSRRVLTGQPNLIGLLANFQAYRDPVRKKSYFFLSLMRNAGLWHYVDDQFLGPPVDYHETRGHLRLGTVVVTDPALRLKLLDNLPVNDAEDMAIRQTVHDAIMLISDRSGLKNPSQLHYLFWNVFRSCCSRDSPHCNGCPADCPLPDRYIPLAIHADGLRRCPFSEVCSSTCSTTHKQYNEHVFDTDYY